MIQLCMSLEKNIYLEKVSNLNYFFVEKINRV